MSTRMTDNVNKDPGIEDVNKVLAEMGETPVQDPEGPEYIMSQGKNPYALLITENICRYLSSHKKWSKSFRYNEFSHMTEVFMDNEWEDLQDHHILEVLRYVSSNVAEFAKVSKSMITDAMIAISYDIRINPPVDFLRSLEWDGKDRLATWLHSAYGAPTNKLYAAIGSNWMKGLVRRVLHPGCQFDEVLVLEGGQGTRKSSSLRALGDPWHVETTYSTDKDFFQVLSKNVIVEFSEGDILTRKGVREVKALITKTEDQYRIPYERSPKTIKRGCVFAMTTNDTTYLKDETGGRRWLPVRLQGDADVDWISENREQLYAEAVHRVEELGETSWEYPQAELQAIQEERAEEETYQEEVEEWYLGLSMTKRKAGVSVKEAYWTVIMPEADSKNLPINKSLEWEIGRIYRRMGLEVKSTRIDEKIVRRWFFTEATTVRFKGRWNTRHTATENVNTEKAF